MGFEHCKVDKMGWEMVLVSLPPSLQNPPYSNMTLCNKTACINKYWPCKEIMPIYFI